MRVFCTKAQRLVEVPRPEQLHLYVCGITPYDAMHLGHVAMLLTYDVLVRRMRQTGTPVRMVRNITDVDDPLLPKALQLGIPYWDLVESEIAQFAQDDRALEMVPADVEPRASAHLDQMVDIIDELLATDRAYRLGEHVYFAVERDDRFGELSHASRERMLELAREHGGDPDRPGKRDPLDFILWQPSRPGEPEYDTKIGVGRPGWHISCSAMSREHVGRRVDVHGGGEDLIFPHHECELAQNQAITGGSEVGVWLHAGFVSYQGEKMSKSLGNIVMARDVLRSWDPRVVRLGLLAHYHHRAGVEWLDEWLDEAAARLDELVAAAALDLGPDLSELAAELSDRVDDDLDFPGAVAVLARAGQAVRAGGDQPGAGARLAEMAEVLGLDLRRPVAHPGA
jgi:L-cysteine:1D-myo-inositol 2-amino-2-deoxy-alpha-D-glucopyranoside ligase